jgi:hypothetical protein
MTVIELPDEQAAALKAKAAAARLTLEAWASETRRNGTAIKPANRHIADIIVENMSNVPPEIMAGMSKDG